ncbi:RNase P modulator RnpM [Mycoplasma sp. P36-A1]|uniref:RNase P modulator RnpM n=1 Tax=Mycoplasma sp. P36-A1 TaxID=3252900 RepID=UPI003C2C7E40
MKQRRVPLRKCLISNEQFPKHEMVRVVIDKDKNISVDTTGKKNGRGAYLKLTKESLELAKKRRVLEREFKVENVEEIYNELERILNES